MRRGNGQTCSVFWPGARYVGTLPRGQMLGIGDGGGDDGPHKQGNSRCAYNVEMGRPVQCFALEQGAKLWVRIQRENGQTFATVRALTPTILHTFKNKGADLFSVLPRSEVRRHTSVQAPRPRECLAVRLLRHERALGSRIGDWDVSGFGRKLH